MNITEFAQKLPNFTVGSLSTAVNNKTDARGWQFQFYEEGKFFL